MKKIFYILF